MARRRQSIPSALKRRIPAGAQVLVGVSGGRDSVVLLHGLLGVRRLLGLELEVAHIDHGLRPCSARDAAFVRDLVEGYGLVCHVASLSAKPHSENTEAWARQERYKAFSRIMAERNLNVLVTAHTANDVAETLLIRLIANKELNSIEEFDLVRRCVRPLLDISRDQIDRYVLDHALSYVEDPSNADPSFVRNRVRSEVLPLLRERFDPSVVWNLADRARSLADDCDALGQAADQLASRVGPILFDNAGWLAGCRRELAGVPSAIRWRAVRSLFAPLLGFTIGEGRANAIGQVLVGESPTVILGAGRRLILKNGALCMESGEGAAD